MAEYYEETIYRFRIMRHDDLPEAHKEAYRAKGVNPDDVWSLVYSVETEEDANDILADLKAEAAKFETFKIVDAGETQRIKRPIMF